MHTQTLATRFARSTAVLRREVPLLEDEMRHVAPSIFASGKHVSRSERYTYIPSIEVLRGLGREGFEPFMVAQARSRIAGTTEYTKHMIRLRHASQLKERPEANEIILINSHDGASSYQMLAGIFRFVCCNGLVVGDVANDIRIPHKGDVRDEVIDGAFRVLDDFERVEMSTDEMKSRSISSAEQSAFATAALALRYDPSQLATPAPITPDQLLEARRAEDTGTTLWHTFQRVQENLTRGGLSGRTTTGRRMQTRPIEAIDRSVALNRALWILAEEMRRILH